MQRYMWPVQQGGGFMDVDPVDHFHGHHPQFMEQMPTVQLHSMDIQPTAPVLPEHRMEIVNQPPPFMQPQPTFTNRHPLSFHVAQTQQVPQQMPQQILQQVPVQPLPQQPMASPVSSPDTPKKKKKDKKRSESPSNSPKGRGRYACLLHRQKHKRCPPDCPERKPKPMKSPGGGKKMSPRKAKLYQAGQMDIGSLPNELPVPRPSKGHGDANLVERPTWESAVSWEDLQWNELNPVQGWSAWDDLRSSSHWEESKRPMPTEATIAPKLQEFDPNQFLMEEKLLQLSDSPEGGVMSDVKVTEF